MHFNFRTYGKLICEDFGANCTCAAISGKGIFHNCCDNDVTMNVLGMRVFPGDATTTMTPEYYEAAGRPDGILINLGTNDWSHVKGNVTGFATVYAEFVEDLATIHGYPAQPAPPFFLGVGPITHDYDTAVHMITSMLAPKGIKCYNISFTTPVDRCGHPPYPSHRLMHEQARPVIASVLGWE